METLEQPTIFRRNRSHLGSSYDDIDVRHAFYGNRRVGIYQYILREYSATEQP